MIRTALACLGIGYTLGVVTVALTGRLVNLSLGFSAGIAFTLIVLVVAGSAVIWAGCKLGWVKSFTTHSQSGGD